MAESKPEKPSQKLVQRQFIFVIGSPGAGKSTLCKLLRMDHDLRYLSVGDLLRDKAHDDPAVGWHVKNGQLLPSERLIPLLREAFDEQDRVWGWCRDPTIIVDGFPRRVDQIKAFEEAFGPPLLVLFVQCPPQLAEARVLKRQDGREGDTREVFAKRYKEYVNLTPAVLDYYSGKDNSKLVEVDTSEGTDASYMKLLEALRSRVKWEELFHVCPE